MIETNMPRSSAGTHFNKKGFSGKSGTGRTGVTRQGLVVTRLFSKHGIHPFVTVTWETRNCVITNEKGETVFEQKGVEFPQSWSQTAVNVVASKFFHGTLGSPEREHSVKQLIGRVTNTITDWGKKGEYFATEEDLEAFRDELSTLLLTQRMSFNSPVWFNVGIEAHPQCSACFINSVHDDMDSILDLAKTEGMLFKWGSGTGTNLSPLRSSKEKLSGGGTASGPVSFMKGYDAFAGVIKSGGKTRRAAKMVILNIDHPDIEEFIWCKAKEEKKAWTLIDAGYDSSFTGEVYSNIFFQNANNSVRVTDEFMQAVIEDKEWSTRSVRTGEQVQNYRARHLLRQIAESTWICGDPGLQYDTTINRWHTSRKSGRINASNPCSEYIYLDDSACNLASLNLMKFLDDDGEFDIEGFRHAVSITILAQEIIVGFAKYPSPAIERNSHDFRPLGLGYANLGALLMAQGLPYDNDRGRDYAAAVTALMGGQSYLTSAKIAAEMGPFAGYPMNQDSFLDVIGMHRRAAFRVNPEHVPEDLLSAARQVWDQALELGKVHGYRNGQVTVLAPTGTISFMMDCDTTGVEPDIALVKYKKLVGGGMLKIVNNTVPRALIILGYSPEDIDAIIKYIDENDTIEGTPALKAEHLPVFDCAFKPLKGARSIHYMGHIKMMAAVQPFISGAISKTINMPNEATTEDIENAYIEGWKLGIKCLAIYRDGCKRSQPLSTSIAKEAKTEWKPRRRRLPNERQAITHKFSIAGHEGYITVGMYEDGSPGEIFLVMAKEGSTISGMMDALATSISIALQYGVPLQVLVDKFSHTRFEPSGFTQNPDIPFAKSVMDYIFRWLSLKFLPKEQAWAEAEPASSGHTNGVHTSADTAPVQAPTAPATPAVSDYGYTAQEDAPSCSYCGSLMVRNGSCYKCANCGATSGCS